MIEKSGIPTQDLINSAYPNEDRRKAGPFAVIECFQNIPCNPCYSSCSRGAILPMNDINDLPKADFDKCNGCAVCVSVCPGLAIFVIDETYSDSEALIKMPYEFLPLPVKGDIVTGTDREGRKVCSATVRNVVNTKAQNRTPVVWLSVPKEFSDEVRFFVPDTKDFVGGLWTNEQNYENCACNGNDAESNGKTYICRCEEITVEQIRKYIAEGYDTLDEIKRVSRAGMGGCQGRTCRQLIMNEISKATAKKPEEMKVTTFRPPVKPIKIGLLANTNDDTEK